MTSFDNGNVDRVNLQVVATSGIRCGDVVELPPGAGVFAGDLATVQNLEAGAGTVFMVVTFGHCTDGVSRNYHRSFTFAGNGSLRRASTPMPIRNPF